MKWVKQNQLFVWTIDKGNKLEQPFLLITCSIGNLNGAFVFIKALFLLKKFSMENFSIYPQVDQVKSRTMSICVF